jgi:hypothetical protein
MPVKTDMEKLIRLSENPSDEAEERGKSEIGDETVDIREYVPGDNLKNIHWKLSAKKADFFVRERGENAKDTAVLLFELSADELNGILDTVYTVLMQYCEEKRPIKLYWAGKSREQLLSYMINCEEDILSAFEKIYSGSLTSGTINPEFGLGLGLGIAKRQLSGGSVLYVGSADKGVTVVDL